MSAYMVRFLRLLPPDVPEDTAWKDVAHPSSGAILYEDRLMAEAVAHALTYTGMVRWCQVYRKTHPEQPVVTVKGALSGPDKASR